MKSIPLLYITLAVILLFGGCKKDSPRQKARIKSASYWLCRAAGEGDIDGVLKSIEKGAVINSKDGDGFTPLHNAAKGRHEGITQFLISKGADVNAKDKSDSTPLILAIRGRRGMFRTFIAKNATDYCKRGDIFNHLREFDRAIEDYTSAIQLKPDNGGAYFLRGCAWAEKGNAEQAVIDWKKSIQLDWRNAMDIYYSRRLLESPDEELDNLIKETAHEHLVDLDTVSGGAVYYGAIPGDFYTVSLIVSEPFEEEKFLDMLQNDNPVVRAMGLICLARENPLLYKEKIHSLYADTASVAYVPGGCVVIGITIGDLARNIIEEPVRINCWSPERTEHRYNTNYDSNRKNEELETIKVIRLLIDNGAQINTQNDLGETPLLIATYRGRQNIVQLLIENGVDVNIKDNDGISPLKEAIKMNYKGLSDLLCKHGATE